MMRRDLHTARASFGRAGARFAALAAAALLVLSMRADAQIRPRPGVPIPKAVPGQVIVWASPGTDAASVAALANGARCDVARALLARDRYLLKVRGAKTPVATEAEVGAAVTALQATGKFRWAGPNATMQYFDVPNDPRYGEQWHLPLINAPQAWDVLKTPSNVIVAVLDSGIDVNHPDLKDRLIGYRNWADPANANDVTDNIPHGTHTAGIAAASTNNGIGVAGIAWGNAKIYAGKVGDFFISYDAAIDAIAWIRQNLNINGNRVVINMSFGNYTSSDTPDPNDPFDAAIVEAAKDGIVFTISAGNAYDQGNPASHPANDAQLHPNILCVASCGPNKEHAFYSEARSYTTISAPGGNDPTYSNNATQILSTFPTSMGSYGFEQGTSMAAPAAAGVVALLMSAGAPSDQIRDILTSTADTVGLSVPNPEYGYGVVDAYAATVLAVTGIRLTSPVNGSIVYGTASVTLKVPDPSKFTKATLTLDNDPTEIGTITAPPYTIAWNTLATDSSTGASRFPNGAHRLRLTVQSSIGPIKFSVPVRVDNPMAQITVPANGGYVTGTASITGAADGLRTPTYTLEYALSTAPATFKPILANQNIRIPATGPLGEWKLSGLPDGPATLRLRVKNPDGFEVSASNNVTIDQTPPTIPTGLKGVSDNRQSTLAWNASTDNYLVAGYNIYRSDKSLTGYARLNTALQSATSYLDGNLTNGKTYFYKVTSVDSAGNESQPTDIIDVTPNRNGTAAGQVVSLGGTFLAGAKVTVLKDGAPLANPQPITTDSAGQFSFPTPPGIAPGTYSLRIEADGYVPELVEGITVDLGKDDIGRNASLQPQPQFGAGYAMFALPYDFKGATLSSVLTAPGASIVYYDPASATYVAPGSASFPKPAPGIGYWLKPGGTAPTITGAGVPTSTGQSAPVPIRVGWNLVGNPFQYPITWVLNNFIVKRADNAQEATLSAAVGLGWALDFGWGGANGKTLLYDKSIVPGVTATVPGYGAFWFFSNVAGTLSIAPPSIVSRAATAASGSSNSQWATALNAVSGAETATVYVGVAGSHKVFPAAPQMTSGLQLGIVGDGRSATETAHAVDLRTSASTQTWTLQVASSGDHPVTITWPETARVPRGWLLTLVDTASGQRVNMRTASSYTLAPSRAARQLSVELTRETHQRLVISNLGVSTGRGTNPVISFVLSRTSEATVAILKANGDPVRTLATRSINAGANSMVWDTRDSAGRNVAPGVYMVQIRAVSERGETVRAVTPVVIIR